MYNITLPKENDERDSFMAPASQSDKIV